MSGYRPCACPDCFEIAIGDEGAMCHECEAAGCTGDGECEAAGAYGGEPEECEDNGCAGCPWCDAAERSAQPLEPEPTIARLLAELDEADPQARPSIEAMLAIIPAAARADGQHAFWSTSQASNLIAALVVAIDTAKAR
jgi:hypothetical protein